MSRAIRKDFLSPVKDNVWWLRVATSSQHHAQHSPCSAGLMSWCELQPASARQRQRWWKWELTQRIKGTKQLKGKPSCFCAVQLPPLFVIYSVKGCQGRVRGEDGISRSPSCMSLLSHNMPCCRVMCVLMNLPVPLGQRFAESCEMDGRS